jgi:hypothetical protein
MTEHMPRRGSDVEQWIKRFRDAYIPGMSAWIALDDLLDDYRLRADLGTPLDQPVKEDHC